MTSAEIRLRAAQLIGRVLREGAYSNVLLNTVAGSLEPRAARAIRKLVYDTLRHLIAADRRISDASRRDMARIDPAVLDVMRVAVVESAVSGRPARAVSTAVEAVRLAHASHAAGFVNGVLRNATSVPLFDDGAPPWYRFGVPEHLYRVVVRSLAEAADPFFEASNRAPSVGIRAPAPVRGATSVPGIPQAYLLDPGVRPPRGSVIQDPASVAVGVAVAAPLEARVLDVAAAPGGKTSHLIEQVGPSGVVVAADRHVRRVTSGRRRVGGARWLVADGRIPPFRRASFDRVLVDAPCSGLGTLRRRPEIRHRVPADAPATMGVLQRRILEQSIDLVRPGGRIVYSVCTVTAEETVDVVKGLGFSAPSRLPGTRLGDGLLLGPHLGPTDGMFIAVADR